MTDASLVMAKPQKEGFSHMRARTCGYGEGTERKNSPAWPRSRGEDCGEGLPWLIPFQETALMSKIISGCAPAAVLVESLTLILSLW